jgi:uncharacterized membrane protein
MATTSPYKVEGTTWRFQGAMWAVMILLCLIGAAAVIRRMIALAHPAKNLPLQLAALDAAFAQKPVLTLIHIIPALVLVSLVPFQFSRSFRNRHLRIHRWMGRTIVVLGLIIGFSALGLLRSPIGGVLEVSAILTFDAVFLLSLMKAFVYARRRQIVLHREWMTRAMSVALGVATVRPIMGVFFATSRLTGLTPHEFFGMAFWIGFVFTYLAGEAWIRCTRRELTPSRTAFV